MKKFRRYYQSKVEKNTNNLRWVFHASTSGTEAVPNPQYGIKDGVCQFSSSMQGWMRIPDNFGYFKLKNPFTGMFLTANGSGELTATKALYEGIHETEDRIRRALAKRHALDIKRRYDLTYSIICSPATFHMPGVYI